MSSDIHSKTGRNDPCPCGSGEKYKRCCLSKNSEIVLPEELLSYGAIQDEEVQRVVEFAKTNRNALLDADFWDDLGTALGTTAHFKESIQCFKKAIAIDPSYLIAKLNLAVSYNSAGDDDEALRLLEEIPEDFNRRDLIKANILKSKDKFSEAIPLYESAIQKEPEFYLPYVNLLVCLKETRHPLYEYWIEKSVSLFNDSPSIAHLFCNYLAEQNRLQELVNADWIDGLESTDGRPDVIGRNSADHQLIFEVKLWRRVASLEEQYSDEDLEATIDATMTSAVQFDRCSFGRRLAKLASDNGKPELVKKAYSKICNDCKRSDEEKNYCWYERALAIAHFRSGATAMALQYAKTIINKHPNHATSLALYWWCLDDAGNVSEAINAAEELFKLNPAEENLAYNLGYLCGKNGNLGKAIHYYEKQIVMKPNHALAIENLTFIKLMGGDIDAAKSCFAQFLAIVSRDDEILAERELDKSDLILDKKQKFDILVKFATENKNSKSFATDLIATNESSAPMVGSLHHSVRAIKLSANELLVYFSCPSQAAEKDIKFQLEMERRGDYSGIINKLKKEVANFSKLPTEAQDSLIEGEARLLEKSSGDYSSVIVLYAKATEICLKRFLFDAFRETCSSEFDIEKEAKTLFTDENKQAFNFLKFIEKGQHIELGSMAMALSLSKGKTAKKVALLKRFFGFVSAKSNGFNLLSDDTLKKIDILVNKYRNPAAHAKTFSIDEAAEARGLSFTILKLF